MKCEFCGKETDEKLKNCEHCGKELKNNSDEPSVSELIDAMPELHDELDTISKIRKRAEHRKRRVIIAILVVLLCIGGVWFGINYIGGGLKHSEPAVSDEVKVESSAISGDVVEKVLNSGFTDVKIFDVNTAKEAIDGIKSDLGITDVNTGFTLLNTISVGNDTYYRFNQTFKDISVYGGEVVIAASKDGKAIALNSRIIETDGLNSNFYVSVGSASNAINEYVNGLSDDLRVVSGTNVTSASKAVCNFEGKTYLAYVSNVSGYNANGEYVAYDAFLDASTGEGIFVRATSSYENEDSAETENAVETPKPSGVSPVAENTNMSMFIVNDKFNWNSKTKTGALEEISSEDISNGLVSAYISAAKSAVDRAYAYFADSFGYRGPDGLNGEYKVYLNANEYLDEKLPVENAIYSDGVLMFIREDMTSGSPDGNVVTHEYAHGVMSNIASLCGTRQANENAALSEGLADVFGELAEARFSGSCDWIHGNRDISNPENSGFLTCVPQTVEINDMTSCYKYSTVISHAIYQMNAGGVSASELGELTFRTVCMMNGDTDFKEWKTLTELSAGIMKESGRLSEEKFSVVKSALDNTCISAQKFYASEVEELID